MSISHFGNTLCSVSFQRPFVCPHGTCDKSYARPAHLKRHLEQIHDLVQVKGEEGEDLMYVLYIVAFEKIG